jgi:hypothetical protein
MVALPHAAAEQPPPLLGGAPGWVGTTAATARLMKAGPPSLDILQPCKAP